MGSGTLHRIRDKFSKRRNSAAPSVTSATSDSSSIARRRELPNADHQLRTAARSSAHGRGTGARGDDEDDDEDDGGCHQDHDHDIDPLSGSTQLPEDSQPTAETRSIQSQTQSQPADLTPSTPLAPHESSSNLASINENSALGPGPDTPKPAIETRVSDLGHTPQEASTPQPGPDPVPGDPARRQSLLPNRQRSLMKTLLQNTPGDDAGTQLPLINPAMMTRKIWVRRQGASATLVTINEDDLVDDVRELILRKYGNSLGRHFDAPDLMLRIFSRQDLSDRTLGPEEHMGRTLDAYYPGGQSVDEALVIDIPARSNPRLSPAIVHPNQSTAGFYTAGGRPSEAGEGYFPPVGHQPNPHQAGPLTPPINATAASQNSLLAPGHGPPPSPGGTRSRAYRERPERPRLGRTHTSSPTVLGNAQPSTSIAAATAVMSGPLATDPRLAEVPPELTGPSPQFPPDAKTGAEAPPAASSVTPPARATSPRLSTSRPKKTKKAADPPSLPPGMLNGGVPPINVLIVEDNPINLKLLEAFVKRLKVRWQTAMNGKDAVTKWRAGGFHLVLMDIQLPVMNGLDATREIRRLERINSIGVLSSSPAGEGENPCGDVSAEDRLPKQGIFKCPVIIVALTASSLQSDRHEALAAGCNDFLTKPVNFVWLERKVMEWGCMQALIDYDGWRKWKDFSLNADENEPAGKKASSSKTKSKKNRSSVTTSS